MLLQLFSYRSVVCLLTLGCLSGARADDLPARKAGLWEMKMPASVIVAWRGQRSPDTTDVPPTPTIQHCTDETVDRDMNAVSPAIMKDVCSKRDIQKTATGYVSDSVCGIAGMSITSHAEITGDFNSAYTVKLTSHSEPGPTGAPRDSTITIEAKWLGACNAGQKAGDIIMPGGMKMNIKDMEKLKGLIPGQK